MDSAIWDQPVICFLDDDENLREIYTVVFSRAGFDIKTAKDGATGMALIREQKPAVILLDLQMPVKNGIQVLQELRKDRELAKIPVVVLSNVDNEETFKAVGKFETRFYLVKALTTPEKVLEIVREIL